MDWEGLSKEVMKFCQEVGLLNPCEKFLIREEVLEAIMYSHLKTHKEEYSMEKLKHLKNTDLRYTRRYSPLRGLTSSSCGGLRPSAEAFFALRAKK